MAHTSPQKIVGWIDPLQVSAGSQDLVLQTPFGVQRYAEIEPGLFEQVDGERRLTFREDDQGQVTHLFWGPNRFFQGSLVSDAGVPAALRRGMPGVVRLYANCLPGCVPRALAARQR